MMINRINNGHFSRGEVLPGALEATVPAYHAQGGDSSSSTSASASRVVAGDQALERAALILGVVIHPVGG